MIPWLYDTLVKIQCPKRTQLMFFSFHYFSEEHLLQFLPLCFALLTSLEKALQFSTCTRHASDLFNKLRYNFTSLLLIMIFPSVLGTNTFRATANHKLLSRLYLFFWHTISLGQSCCRAATCRRRVPLSWVCLGRALEGKWKKNTGGSWRT